MGRQANSNAKAQGQQEGLNKFSKLEIITGKAGYYAESGSEGAYYAVHKKGAKNSGDVEIIKQGDMLEISSRDGKILFCGIVDMDTNKRCAPPIKDALGSALSQKDWNLEDWQSLFRTEKNSAKLVRIQK